ncbi:unnamed protein product [Cuscuta campestris]|uniref:Uncharacterized protein n=1 Tax=Cuscuta campestris TaxID=132261 RepID=A0A484KQM8_9ASTE|nr:unnamed protein product [Cuscuta campestris]
MSREKTTKAVDEVEELLRAAADETLLQLSVDAHTTRGSSTQFIAPDLDRRFQALKTRPKSSSIPNKHPKTSAPTASLVTDNVNCHRTVGDGGDENDLFARFAALKSSLPSYSSSAGSGCNPRLGRVELENVEDEDEDDQVEKLIKWAVDAARLDPSPPSDTDYEDDDDNSDSHSEDEDNDGTKRQQKRK